MAMRGFRITTWRTIVALPVLAALAACSGTPGDALSGNTSASAPSAWRAVARGTVDVEGGLARVVATRDGVIADVDAQEGDQVKAGQVLARMDARVAAVGLASARAEQAQAQAQLAEAQAKLAQAQRQAQSAAAAAHAGAASGQAADDARAAATALAAQADAARAALELARQHVAAAQLDVDARTLRAPVAGVVVQRDAQVGQGVAAASGASLFSILPDRPRVVRAQLDADVADAVKPGQRAEVVRDSGEGQAYAATVLRVGQVLVPSSLSDDPLARATARDVDCLLRLDAPQAGAPGLRVGQRVLVRFPK